MKKMMEWILTCVILLVYQPLPAQSIPCPTQTQVVFSLYWDRYALDFHELILLTAIPRSNIAQQTRLINHLITDINSQPAGVSTSIATLLLANYPAVIPTFADFLNQFFILGGLYFQTPSTERFQAWFQYGQAIALNLTQIQQNKPRLTQSNQGLATLFASFVNVLATQFQAYQNNPLSNTTYIKANNLSTQTLEVAEELALYLLNFFEIS